MILTFTLFEEIGAGGLAVVRRGRRQDTGEWVALKCLHEVGNQDARHRFEREVRILESLDHSGIIKILAYNVNCERPFYAMPLMAGSLSALCGKLTWPHVRGLVHRLSHVLAYIHGRHGFHRDLKPANVLMSHSGEFFLADFGLGNVPGCTQRFTNNDCGTPGYAAPELDYLGASSASDMYSLGATLFHVITGASPGTAKSFDIRRWKSDAPQDLRDLVFTLTLPKPMDRPTAHQVFQDSQARLSANNASAARRLPSLPAPSKPALNILRKASEAVAQRAAARPAERIPALPDFLKNIAKKQRPVLGGDPPPVDMPPLPPRREKRTLLEILAGLGVIYLLVTAASA